MIGEKFLRRQFYKTVDQVLDRVDNYLTWILKVSENAAKKIEAKNGARDVLVKKRENLQKNFLNNENQDNLDLKEKKKQTSMLHSQGESDHSASSYHGPGKAKNNKVNSNMWQRNFENHQSN